MSGHGKREELTSAEIAAIRAERAAGAGQQRLAFKWRIGSRRVCEICGEVAPAPARGRKTALGDADVVAIRAERAEGMPIMDIARRWRISPHRARRLVEGVAFRRVNAGRPGAALDEAAFRAAGIPDTPTNRAACRGHSRAWMRLYRLRLDRPDYADFGDAVEAIPLKRRG
jgi:hypothetical protein